MIALFISFASFRALVNHVPAGEAVPRASSRAVVFHSMRAKLSAQVIFDLHFHGIQACSETSASTSSPYLSIFVDPMPLIRTSWARVRGWCSAIANRVALEKIVYGGTC